MGAHDGHRNRMRERIAFDGIDGLQDHEILEYVLFHFVPMKNTNEMAHSLINAFGSLADVLNADVERLTEIRGMTANAALFLSVLPDIFRRYAFSTAKERIRLGGRGSAREFIRSKLYGCPVEQVYVAAMDAQDGLIRFEKLGSGSGNGVAVSVRDIVDFAMRTKAAGIIIAHNHPSGSLNPSQADYDLTKDILFTLDGIGVELQDHFIFADGDSYSFEENGILKRMLGEKKSALKEGRNRYE